MIMVLYKFLIKIVIILFNTKICQKQKGKFENLRVVKAWQSPCDLRHPLKGGSGPQVGATVVKCKSPMGFALLDTQVFIHTTTPHVLSK